MFASDAGVFSAAYPKPNPDKFEWIGRGRTAWRTKTELSNLADPDTPRRLPHGTYVLHRPVCSQADHQLLHERQQWQDLQ
jgi:hypothetical protein